MPATFAALPVPSMLKLATSFASASCTAPVEPVRADDDRPQTRPRPGDVSGMSTMPSCCVLIVKISSLPSPNSRWLSCSTSVFWLSNSLSE